MSLIYKEWKDKNNKLHWQEFLHGKDDFPCEIINNGKDYCRYGYDYRYDYYWMDIKLK